MLTKRLVVLVSPKLWRQVRADAKRVGMKPSAYVRWAIEGFSKLTAPVPASVLPEATDK